MQTAKFCSHCGEKMLTGGSRLLSSRVLCAECAPRFRSYRPAMLAGIALLAAVAFLAGRYTGSHRPFYFIGTPVDLQSTYPISNRDAEPAETKPTSADATESVCGAMTRSGKPCQRRVRNGSRCYQHRDKLSSESESIR
jgi:hypothetical protein